MAINHDTPTNCGQVRRKLLAAPTGPQPLSAEWRRVTEHLDTCADCRNFLTEQQGWARVGRRLSDYGEAPEAVRLRLFRALALARTGQPEATTDAKPATAGRPLRTLVLSLSLLCVVAGAGALGFTTFGVKVPGIESSPNAGVADIITEDHWRELHRAVIDSNDATEVQHWLQSRLTIPVQVFELEGAVLEGGRLCFVRSQRGAVVRYRIDNQPVSYFVMPVAVDSSESTPEDALRNEAEKGYNVVTWRERGLAYALVGALSQERLATVARSCREQTHTAGMDGKV
jgi:anti-sigma factor RsiW